MRIGLVTMIVVAGLLASQGSVAEEVTAGAAEISWGNSGAAGAPVKDVTRSGHWWRPTEPSSNEGDAEVWGNRGVVYGTWRKPVQTSLREPPAAPEPPNHGHPLGPIFDNVCFEFDSAEISPQGKNSLDQGPIRWMRKFPNDTLTIEGHTCDIGDEVHNMPLGQRRAEAAKEYVVNSGIASERIQTRSYGESQPAVRNDSEKNRRLNRRVVFSVTLPK